MSDQRKHRIEIGYLGNHRSRWACDCGNTGTTDDEKVDAAAEKHVPDGDTMTYRYTSGGAVGAGYVFRIEYTFERRRRGEDDFTEVGFGSSGSFADINAAVHQVQADVQNRHWVTSPGMPDAADVEGGAR